MPCALALGACTVLGVRRVLARVSRGLERRGAAVEIAAQASSAGVILAADALGLELSTSTVVTSVMVGPGCPGAAGTYGEPARPSSSWSGC